MISLCLGAVVVRFFAGGIDRAGGKRLGPLFMAILLLVPVPISWPDASFAASPAEVTAPAQGYGTVNRLPFREAWYGMYFQDDKIGYSHFRIEATGDRFTIHIESVVQLTALKKTQQISMRQRVIVRDDLSLVSLQSALRINNEEKRVTGIVKNDRLSVEISIGKDKQHVEVPLTDKLFHASAVSLMAPLKGMKDGAAYIFYVFNEEMGRVEKVEQHVARVHGPPGPGGAVWKVSTAVGKQKSQFWMDKKGLTVLDQGPDGSLMTILEDESTAKEFLTKKRQSRDFALDVGLVRVSTPIADPQKTCRLEARVKGVDPGLIARDHRQTITDAGEKNEDGFRLTVTAENPADLETDRSVVVTEADSRYLLPTLTIQADHSEITGLARKIASPNDPPLKKVRKLVHWTSKNIRSSPRESFTALSALRAREGECQAHANLYAALARALGVPTRIAMGLVYMAESKGFLYHAWAESHVGSWIAVDPTFNQIPADATHVKIAQDEDPEDGRTVLGMIGKVRIEVLAVR